MIVMVCAGCRSKLQAKDEWAGQTKKCPKCGKPVQVPVPEPPAEELMIELVDEAEPPPTQRAAGVSEDRLAVVESPDRLNRSYRYVICDRTRLLAAWRNDGNGWLWKTNAGFASVSRNADKFPPQGHFVLVELQLNTTSDGLRLMGLVCYRLAERYALTQLVRSEDGILSTVHGPGSLNREQKMAVRQYLQDAFMRPVWASSRDVLDYLGNNDCHSQGVGGNRS